MEHYKFEVVTSDKFIISATHFPASNETAPVVLIAGATGVPQIFYKAIATALTDRDSPVYTFDYRHVGRSLYGDLKDVSNRLSSWGEFDLDAMLAHVARHNPGRPLVVVGHSIGGQILGLARHSDVIQRALCVAGGHGYWGYYGERAEINRVYWSEQIPNSARSEGYLDGKKNKLADLCTQMAVDLAAWCCSPHYMIDDAGEPLRPHFDQIEADLTFLVPSDDHISPILAVEKMAEFYTRAQTNIVSISPEAYGLDAIGHLGFFRPDIGAKIWGPYLDWLLSGNRAVDNNA
jgi:predicted alpha/beta hydrolase